jgi:hypothetical protein
MRAKQTSQRFGSAIFRIVGCLILPLGLALGQNAAEETAKSTYTIIKVTEMDKTVTFTVLMPEDLRTLNATVNAEQKALDRAYNNLVNSWKAKHNPKTRDRTGKRPKIPSYPLKRPEPRKISYVASFPTEAEALAKKTECEAKEAVRLEEAQKREASADSGRPSRNTMPGSDSVLSNPNAPMATAKVADEIDPDLQKELLAQLKKEIDAIIAKDAEITPGVPSKSGKTNTQVKRLGEGGTTQLDKNPGEMGKPPKPSK